MKREPLGVLLAHVTGLINQELLLKNEYLDSWPTEATLAISFASPKSRSLA